MKRVLIIILCFTNLVAFSQSILVNNQSVNVSSDISFPYWLDSTSTLEIDSHVVSISVLEFNITPTANGNSLVFNQAKIVTSQETVPPGKTWKVESVLLDPSFTQLNNSGGTTVVSGGGGSLNAVALSNESSNYYSFTDGMIYCDSLVEDGYDNWSVPSLEEITFVASGGGIVPGVRSTEKLWTRTNYDGAGSFAEIMSFWNVISLSGGFGVQPTTGYSQYTSAAQRKIRCVRHAAVTVSSGGGSSSGGSTPSTLGNGMPTMISNESSSAMRYKTTFLYCDSLSEGGYDDWILPNLEQMTYALSGGCVVPGNRTVNYLATRTFDLNEASAGNNSSIGVRADDMFFEPRIDFFYYTNWTYVRCVR